jgi:hypothetical protein
VTATLADAQSDPAGGSGRALDVDDTPLEQLLTLGTLRHGRDIRHMLRERDDYLR